jgi:hypothetical protein
VAQELTADVEIVSREEDFYDDPGDAMKLSRVKIARTFHGDLEGTSSASIMLAQPGGAFVAQERFTGSIGGRTGTVVFSHGRVNAEPDEVKWGVIVAGSGTGELEGIGGTVTFVFSGSKASLSVVLND